MAGAVRKVSFGEILSGVAGGCACAAASMLMGVVLWISDDVIVAYGFVGLVFVIFVALAAQRIEIHVRVGGSSSV
jgi:hypothetical protein